MSIFLAPLLANTLPPASTASLVIITDSLLQPGLTLLREFIGTTLDRDDTVVLVTFQQPARRLLPAKYDTNKIDIIDCITSRRIASSSNSHHVNLRSSTAIAQLERTIQDILEGRRRNSGGVTVVLDSVDELADKGVHCVVRILSRLLGMLGERKDNSRLVILHHASYPTPPSSQSSSIAPSLLSTLLSPSLSPTTIHLTLHPSPLIELLSREYGLSIPLSTTASLDLRITSFLQSFTARGWGSPFVRPKSSSEEDERIALDLGGEEGGGFVVEWSSRGVSLSNAVSGGAAGVGAKGATKKIVSRGLEGCRLMSGGKVEMVALREVVNYEKMAQISLPPLSSVASSAPAAKAPTTKANDAPLPFNLSLTDNQRTAREGVILPYLPKEDGSVDYIPDQRDDFDDDDPDEDLEI